MFFSETHFEYFHLNICKIYVNMKKKISEKKSVEKDSIHKGKIL